MSIATTIRIIEIRLAGKLLKRYGLHTLADMATKTELVKCLHFFQAVSSCTGADEATKWRWFLQSIRKGKIFSRATKKKIYGKKRALAVVRKMAEPAKKN